MWPGNWHCVSLGYRHQQAVLDDAVRRAQLAGVLEEAECFCKGFCTDHRSQLVWLPVMPYASLVFELLGHASLLRALVVSCIG